MTRGPTPGAAPDLDGRRFTSVSNTADGEVDAATVFEYHQDGTSIHARYTGGSIELGFLVGSRSGDELDFRYVHRNVGGDTASGHCRSRLELLDDGRIRMHETWQWESRPGSGTSVVDELP